MNLNSALISQDSLKFSPGYTRIVGVDDSEMGIEFGIQVVERGQALEEEDPLECAWLLLSGEAELRWGPGLTESAKVSRQSVFSEPPTVLHLPANTPVEIRALSDSVEWARMATFNTKSFPPKLFLPDEVSSEARGKSLVQDACLRNVRLVFDQERRANSNLVLGEVVNLPGRWSSYPPHHHPQPEIYHYRFSLPQGYGHAELGETVLKIKNQDTIKISGGLSHAQVSAPGYGMYYLWVIRHLPEVPYQGFQFDPDHEWVTNPKHPHHQQEVLCRWNESR